MSHLQYFSYAKNFHYSQSVRLPHNQILVSGQPGLNRETGKIPTDHREEIDQAFRNVDMAVKEAGGSGIEQVYKLNIYFAPLTEGAMEPCGAALKEWFPKHAPLLTGIGVEKLALEGMRVEIEAWAHDDGKA
ncbi:uncharacterized protein RHO25_005900 [Cercospora beticola]|uniref:Uncharacterized protein n=1 Tax=Cercospora beticola TaxID=122368 RepID=A0ABZ0NNZ6_CERBT|nr:hypothetical protein RHO25_005900 [Cercospora beticola]CAK1363957.1 unnamed protein product [Cercospora beticola]